MCCEITLYSTIVAHLLTILFCWAVVTRLRQQPFFASLGWNWAGHSPVYWLLIAIALFIGINMANATSLTIGGDYEFRVVLRARGPGRYHVHPLINVYNGGPIQGPS